MSANDRGSVTNYSAPLPCAEHQPTFYEDCETCHRVASALSNAFDTAQEVLALLDEVDDVARLTAPPDNEGA